MIGLRKFIEQKLHERFLGEKIFLSPQSDITPLIDFLIFLITDWIRERFIYYAPIEKVSDIRSELTEKIWREIKRDKVLSIDRIAIIAADLYEKNKEAIIRELRSRGVILLRDYKDISTLFKSELRFKILKIISRSQISARKLANTLRCREEVVRRVISELRRMGILMEQASISKTGRPIKTYKLITPVVIIDLRQLD